MLELSRWTIEEPCAERLGSTVVSVAPFVGDSVAVWWLFRFFSFPGGEKVCFLSLNQRDRRCDVCENGSYLRFGPLVEEGMSNVHANDRCEQRLHGEPGLASLHFTFLNLHPSQAFVARLRLGGAGGVSVIARASVQGVYIPTS